jgi:hypothetical protein
MQAGKNRNSQLHNMLRNMTVNKPPAIPPLLNKVSGLRDTADLTFQGLEITGNRRGKQGPLNFDSQASN